MKIIDLLLGVASSNISIQKQKKQKIIPLCSKQSLTISIGLINVYVAIIKFEPFGFYSFYVVPSRKATATFEVLVRCTAPPPTRY